MQGEILVGTMYLTEEQFNVCWPNFGRIFRICGNSSRNPPEYQHNVSHKKLAFREHQFWGSSIMTLTSPLTKFSSCRGKRTFQWQGSLPLEWAHQQAEYALLVSGFAPWTYPSPSPLFRHPCSVFSWWYTHFALHQLPLATLLPWPEPMRPLFLGVSQRKDPWHQSPVPGRFEGQHKKADQVHTSWHNRTS